MGAALVIRLAWVATMTTTGDDYASDPATYLRMAREFASGSTPTIGGVATAFFPPAYPALLTPLVWVTDLVGAPSLELAATILNAVLGALTVGLVGVLAGRMFSAHAGDVAAWWAALGPAAIVMTGQPMTETFFTFLVVVAALVAWNLSEDRPAPRRLVALGALVGLAVLTRAPGLALVALPAFSIRTRQGSWEGALRATGWTLAGVLIAVAPWTLRNGLEVGVWTPTSTNSATALCAGNRSGADGRWVESPEMMVECLHDSPWDNAAIHGAEISDPALRAEAAARGVTLGTPDESAWYGRTVARSLRWAVEHPVDELRLVARKAYFALRDDIDPQYFPSESDATNSQLWDFLRGVANLWYWTVLACFGIALVRFPACRRAVNLWGTAALLLAFVLGGVAFPQFRAPAMPLVVMLAAVPLARLRSIGTVAPPQPLEADDRAPASSSPAA